MSGNGTAGTPYQLADIYGVQGMGSSGMLGKFYALAGNVDASGTVNWNAGAGFVPVGNATTPFTGTFDGLGHTISNLFINRPATDYVGLFGYAGTGSVIRNVGLLGGSVSGTGNVGGLVGVNSGTINNSYDTGSVTSGSASAGGLVGSNAGTVSNSYATGNVTGGGPSVTYAGFGGLVGSNTGTISGSYATGNVIGGNATYSYFADGGLVGYNSAGTIINCYATGSVSNTGNAAAAGLVGFNGGSVSNSYSTGSAHSGSTASPVIGNGLIGYGNSAVNSFWNITTSGLATSTGGGTGLTTAQMMQSASFASWNTATPNTIANTGGSGAVWRIYEGHTAPLLTSFLPPLSLADAAATYNGAAQSGTTTALAGVLGTAATGTNAGNYSSGYYSTQQGYDLSGGNLTVSKAALTAAITGTPTRTYDGSTAATLAASNYNLTGFITGEGATVGQTAGTYNSKDVATATTINATLAANDFTGTGSTLLANYFLPTTASGAGSITPAGLTVTANALSKTAGGVDPLLTYMTAGLQAPDTTTSTLSGALARLSGETAGLYPINQGTLASLSTNYTMSYVPADFGIVAAAVAPAPVVTAPVIAASLMDALMHSIVTPPPSPPFNPPVRPVMMQPAPVVAVVAPAVNAPVDSASATGGAGVPADAAADDPKKDVQAIVVADATALVAAPVAQVPMPVCK